MLDFEVVVLCALQPFALLGAIIGAREAAKDARRSRTRGIKAVNYALAFLYSLAFLAVLGLPLFILKA